MFNHDLSALPDPELDAQFYDGVPFKRLLAWVIDVAIVSLTIIALLIASIGLFAFFFVILVFGVNLGYRWFFLTQNSATLGMSLMGIEIRDNNGNKLDSGKALAHSLGFIVLFLPIFFFLPVLASAAFMLTNERGQGLHDMVLGTTAINRPAK